MLARANVQPMLPVSDMKGAKRFYEDILGLERVGGHEDTAVYRSGSTTLCVYRSEYAGSNKGTAALWEVDDVAGVVRELKERGARFERYPELPGLTIDGDVHRAGDFSVAWLKDPAGNILSVQSKT